MLTLSYYVWPCVFLMKHIETEYEGPKGLLRPSDFFRMSTPQHFVDFLMRDAVCERVNRADSIRALRNTSLVKV